MPIWLITAWQWIKKNWKWLLFPIGLGLYLLGRVTALRRPEINVLAPEAVGASKERQEATEEQQKTVREAVEKRDKEVKEIEEGHLKNLKKLTDEQAKDAERLSDHPDELNKYLKKVGENMRG